VSSTLKRMKKYPTEDCSRATSPLKLHPFEFIEHGPIPGALPEEFFEVDRTTNVAGEALACMAVLLSRPPTWRWTPRKLALLGYLTEKFVKTGLQQLQAEGWIRYVDIFYAGKEFPRAGILVFREMRSGEDADSRFALHHTEDGWRLPEDFTEEGALR